jgi:hypothetical protein
MGTPGILLPPSSGNGFYWKIPYFSGLRKTSQNQKLRNTLYFICILMGICQRIFENFVVTDFSSPQILADLIP